MSQGTTNKVSLCKAKINKMFKTSINRLQFVTADFEITVDENTTLYVDIENNDCNNYEELHLLGVELLRDDKSYENIALFLAEKIDEQIQDLNLDRYKEYLDWEYQKDYETIGGRYAYD